MITINPIKNQDSHWIKQFLTEQAGSSLMVSRGRLLDAVDLPGFIACWKGKPSGLLTYHLANDELEIFTLHTAVQGKGLGTALIDAAIQTAKVHQCRRVWLITTNDNIQAIRFYQKRGMVITAVHVNALEYSRTLKPQIPLIGNDGIPLRDEIEFEIRLQD